MNAPQFLRRNQQAAKREPMLHPVDLDAAATVDLYAGKVRKQVTEAQAMGDLAEQAVLRATQLSKEVMQMVDESKAVAAQIEAAGLRLIAEVQAKQDEFNNRTQEFIASATTLHNGLLDTLAKVGKPQEQPKTVEADPAAAAQIETGLADIVQQKAAERK